MDQRGVAPRTVLSPSVVGREAELAFLHDALHAAAECSGSMVFLVGEAGIGKSRLAAEVASEAGRRGLVLLRGRAVQAAAPAAYRPLAEALCSAVRAGAVAAEELTPYRATLSRLVPEWRTESALAVDDSVVALSESVLRFLRVVAGGRGCVLVLEDLHWSDPDTVRVAEYLADNLAGERTLCLVTLRDEQPSAALQLAQDLHARRVSPVVRLPRLGRHDVAEMVGSCLDTLAVGDRLLDFAARAGGVPFLVEELLAAGVSSGALVAHGESWDVSDAVGSVVPFSFAETIRRRLSDLGEPGRSVLLAAAVLGRRFDWRLLPPITERGDAEVLAALRAAVDAQILTIDATEPTFRFRHALSRDAVLADLLPPEIAALSRRALTVLEAAHPTSDDEWGELAAELAEGAGDRGRAARLLLHAGRRALARGALASAETALDRARALADDDGTATDVDECLLQVLSLAGKWDRARELVGSLLPRLGDDQASAPRCAELYLRLARAALSATRWAEADELVERARAQLPGVADESLAARIDAVAAQAAIMSHPPSAAPLAEAALASALRLGLPEVACEALEVLGRVERPVDLDAAEGRFLHALSLAEASGLELWRARALHELGTIDMLRGRPVSRLEEARELAVVQGALATAAVVDVQIAAALVFEDDPEPATAVVRRCADLAERYALHQTLAAALALEAYVHARARRGEAMRRCAADARARAPGVADVEVKLATAAGVLGLVQEDRPAARRHLEEADRYAGSGPGDHAASPAGGFLALLRSLESTQRQPPAEPLRTSVHFVAVAFHRYAAAVLTGGTDPVRAHQLVAEADDVLGDHRWLRQLGRRLVAEAAIDERWGDPVSWLREALAYFDERGDDALASACRSLLRRAGAPVPRRRGDTAVPPELRGLGVTARELEVLRLVGQGLPNKEIASRLYLSPRTVERHVANLSTKTGVARRSELVALAATALAAVDGR